VARNEATEEEEDDCETENAEPVL